MARDNSIDSAEQELKKLEFRIFELIQTCERLKEENRTLREEGRIAVADHDRLESRNSMARERLESAVERLRTMESSP